MRDHTELVTIAIPVYERYDFFEKAINSAINQSITCSIIVVDNASSHPKFEDFCSSRNIKYFRNEFNIGMFPNWNKCFELADSAFVHILGDDDYLENNYIESFLNQYKEFPSLDLYFSDFEVLNYSTLSFSNHNHIFPFGFMDNNHKIREYGIRYGLSFPIITSTIRKSKFKGFYSDEHGSNDWEWAYLKTKDFNFFGESKKLLFRGSHGSNDSGNINTKMRTSLSMAYIYEQLARSTKDIELQKISRKKSRNTFLYFLYLVNENFVKELLKTNFKYSKFLNEKHSENIIYGILLKLPYQIKKKLLGFFIYFKII
jgi:hypothetical protein